MDRDEHGAYYITLFTESYNDFRREKIEGKSYALYPGSIEFLKGIQQNEKKGS